MIGNTPFQVACTKFKRKDVIDVVEETLARYNPTTPINTMDALLLAAIDERIRFDCVYFLLRRQPDVLMRMRQPRLTDNNSSSDRNGAQDSTVDDDDNDDDDDDHDDDDISNHGYDADGNNDSNKRKRKGWN